MSTDYDTAGAPSINSINDDVGATQKTIQLPGVVIRVDHKVDKGETCCKSCYYGVYSFFGTLFCFKKGQSLMSLLGITWLWTLFIPLFIGMILGFYVYAPFNFVSSPGDQRNVMGDYDAFFCDGINLNSPEPFNAYLLGKKPAIMQNNRSYNSFELMNITMKPDSYQMWNFYLLQGSIVQFDLCNAKETEFFMLRGTNNYNKWVKHPTNCECFMEHISYPHGSGDCANHTNPNDTFVSTYNFTTNIGKTDDYYLVFQNPSANNPNEMNINLQLNRSTYDIQGNVKDSCMEVLQCNLSLSFLSAESVVYESTEETPFNTANHVECNPTWAVYFTLFGGIPMIVGFCISMLWFVLFMHCPRAWEGVYRPKPWDEEKKPPLTASILDTLPETKDIKTDKNKQQSKDKESKSSSNGKKKLFGSNSGYDALSEEDTDEESMATLPGRTPPPDYSYAIPPPLEADTVQEQEEPSREHPELTGATNNTESQDAMNGVVHAEIHHTPE